jgi:Na+/H+ antiporter NhaA
VSGARDGRTSALLGPLERFLALEAASGIVLLAALAWAGSAWSASYHALWQTPVSSLVSGALGFTLIARSAARSSALTPL